MIQDYVGQETIWNLTGNHPYKLNNFNGIEVIFRAETPRRNEEIVSFFKEHLKEEEIKQIVMEYRLDAEANKGDWYPREIQVINCAGNTSLVRIMNMFGEELNLDESYK